MHAEHLFLSYINGFTVCVYSSIEPYMQIRLLCGGTVIIVPTTIERIILIAAVSIYFIIFVVVHVIVELYLRCKEYNIGKILVVEERPAVHFGNACGHD